MMTLAAAEVWLPPSLPLTLYLTLSPGLRLNQAYQSLPLLEAHVRKLTRSLLQQEQRCFSCPWGQKVPYYHVGQL